ncbi:NACHT, LRR and PYD domains-containing protein 3-like [Trichomycterus rosablanca]|uniref:NACHT, LRR and PYD domains-containing protein 3-like n=1 Tax=Trichomycterus rosablanca TaxID=2290929 RepID=UPI002F35F3F3
MAHVLPSWQDGTTAQDQPESRDHEQQQNGAREGAPKSTELIHQPNPTLQTKLELITVCQQKLKSKLVEKYRRVSEGIQHTGTLILLNEIYTELYITEGSSGDINSEHEVRQIQTASGRPTTQETTIRCNKLFKDGSIRTVLTTGVAGIGKTMLIKKFVLDWAEGKANQDVMFMFPLLFRELNLIKEAQLSLIHLLHQSFPEIKDLQSVDFDSQKVVFILCALDEKRLPLDFQKNEIIRDVTEPASVDILLTNLIKGNLLPSAHLWITCRSGADDEIPPECVDQVTEVRGFNDSQKEEYFRKRINDQSLADKIIRHVKSTRSLHIMCHIPVFCWISAAVFERMLSGEESGEIPKTLTQMFTYFLIFQTKHKDQKYQFDADKTRQTILALGKLAFQQLEKNTIIFYEEDLRECGIDVKEASVYSGVCTQIFREEFGLNLFSFVHVTVQEFLAALYAYLTFVNKNVTEKQTTDLSDLFNQKTMSEFLKTAVKKALQKKNGNLDLFLRFLLGLSHKSNQNALRDLLPETEISSHSQEDIIKYIKKKIKDNPSPEKSISLFHCLNELNDNSLVQEVQNYLNSGDAKRPNRSRLSSSQWSALAFVLLSSDEELDEFDLRKYEASERCFLRMLPVVTASKKAMLNESKLTKKSCEALSSVLSSSSLIKLNLSNNNLKDSGVKRLFAGLKDPPQCKLEILWLSACKLTKKSCEALSSVLSSESSSLIELNLSNNNLKDSGVKRLFAGLKDPPQCKLEILWLSACKLTKKICRILSSILSSESSSLKDLNLSNNDLHDSGVKLLCDGLENPNCKLEILRLSSCRITDSGFTALDSALRNNRSSHLRELNLSNNKAGKSGEKLIKDLQEYLHSRH